MAVAPMLATALLLLGVSGCGEKTMGFDKAGWAGERGNYDGKNVRAGMTDGLEAAGVKLGATRDAVRALLGEPDSTGPAADIYFLGRSATGPSYESWRIDYSPAGVVTGMRLERS